MFNDLESKWIDGRRILSIDEFPDHEQCGVHFADDKEPKVAVVHQDELKYLVFDNEKESIEERPKALSTATSSLQGNIMDKLRFYNPKWKEMKPITDNINDSLSTFQERFNRAIFGGESGEYDRYALNLETIISTIVSHGKEVDYSGFTEKGQAMLKCLLEIHCGYEEACQIIPSFRPALMSLFNQACQAAIGMQGNEIRLRDMIDLTEKYEEVHGMPKELTDPNATHIEITPPVAAS